jgi:hypothetical protein
MTKDESLKKNSTFLITNQVKYVTGKEIKEENRARQILDNGISA